MPEYDQPNAHQVQLGEVLQQSKTNAAQIVEMRSEFSQAITELRKAIGGLSQSLSAETKPNFSVMAAWAGVLLSIVAMVAAPIAYYFNHSVEAIDSKLQKEYELVNATMMERVNGLKAALLEMDIRLQREFLAANTDVKKTADVLTATWAERHKDLIAHVDRLEGWTDERTKADLEELRRFKNGEIPRRK